VDYEKEKETERNMKLLMMMEVVDRGKEGRGGKGLY